MENKEQRMRDLVEFYKNKNEIFVPKKEDKENVNNEGLQKEYQRLKNLTSPDTNSTFKENFVSAGDWNMGGGNRDRTVNSIVDQMFDNSAVMYKPSRQPLNPEEAFNLAIKRTLKSGAPINDVGFYDEVNWQLMSLGFPAKLPLDIKNALLKLIEK